MILLLTGGANAALEDNLAKTRTPDGASLDRIFSDWARWSAARSGLDARFARVDRDSMWGDHENYAGRAVFLPKGLALVEMRKDATARHAAETERFVWTTNEFHWIRLEQKTHFIMPIAEKDQRRIPVILALPLFWHVSVDGMKSHYRIESS